MSTTWGSWATSTSGEFTISLTDLTIHPSHEEDPCIVDGHVSDIITVSCLKTHVMEVV